MPPSQGPKLRQIPLLPRFRRWPRTPLLHLFLAAWKYRLLESPAVPLKAPPIVLPLGVLFVLPRFVYSPDDGAIWRPLRSFWGAALHMSPILAAFVVVVVSVWFAPQLLDEQEARALDNRRKKKRYQRVHSFSLFRPQILASIITCLLALATLLCAQLQLYHPSPLWAPFSWGAYRVFSPFHLRPALEGLCPTDYKQSSSRRKRPLCLTESSWRTLSAGQLSSYNSEDVRRVRRGLQYAQEESNGIVFGILARDTVGAVLPLRQNVESLLQFFNNKVSVVIFENDSVDGTRDALKEWAATAKGYTVNLLSCGEVNPDCRFHESHRYLAENEGDFLTSSAIGKMPQFRQRVLDYILAEAELKDFSHMLVVDLDLEVSISPLGILHCLGTLPNKAVAVSSKMPSPGTLGSILAPYDVGALRFLPTVDNQRALDIHEKFCGLSPPGDRWRFECHSVSIMQWMLLYDITAASSEPYPMESAYNGAVIYPMALVRRSGAKYDSGTDGQRCEHVGFHISLDEPVYVNPRWSFNVNLRHPPGPNGETSTKGIMRVLFLQPQSIVVYLQGLVMVYLFSSSVMSVTLFFFYPLMMAAGCRYFGVRRTLPQ